MRKFTLTPANRKTALNAIYAAICEFAESGNDVLVTVREDDDRTPLQNKKMWAMLRDIAKQLDWVVNGKAQKIDEDDWKDILTSGLRKSQRLAQGIEGGMVMLGCRTSKMSKKEVAELIEFIYWFGSENEVNWTEAKRYM